MSWKQSLAFYLREELKGYFNNLKEILIYRGNYKNSWFPIATYITFIFYLKLIRRDFISMVIYLLTLNPFMWERGMEKEWRRAKRYKMDKKSS